MSDTLYKLDEVWQEVASMMEDVDADEQVFKDTLDAIDWNNRFKEKMDSYVMIIRNTEVSIGSDDGKIAAVEKILNDMKTSKKAKENKVKYMKESMLKAMNDTGNTKFESDNFKFWTQKTTPTLVIDDEANIPLKYYTTPEPQLDKKMIRDDLKTTNLPFAHLEEKETVRFR